MKGSLAEGKLAVLIGGMQGCLDGSDCAVARFGLEDFGSMAQMFKERRASTRLFERVLLRPMCSS